MSKLGLIFRVVIHQSESNIRFRVDPDGERVPVGDKHPLADIKLLFVHNERVFYVLLDDPVPAF